MVTQTSNGTVVFQFYRPDVSRMTIAGDFNGWQHSFYMTRGRDGWWRSQIELAPGTYRFRYVGDGQWFTDYAAFGVEPGPFGWNSVLKVDAPQVVITPEPTPVVEVLEPVMACESSDVDEDADGWSEPLPQRGARRVRRRPALAGQH
jgi:hypothetical protein